MGYKTVDEHLKDCQMSHQQKRWQILKHEQERVKANKSVERKTSKTGGRFLWQQQIIQLMQQRAYITREAVKFSEQLVLVVDVQKLEFCT